MDNKTLTISVAAYNVEEYLPQTLDSLVACGTFDELDVLVVNDGSTDGTLAVARKYEELYPMSIRVIDKPNGGYGSNINSSILEASGRYYRLLDGDDWVDSCELDRLVRFLGGTDADLVVAKYSSVRGGDKRLIALDWPYDGETQPLSKRLDYRYSMHMLSFKTEQLHGALVDEPIIEHTNYTDFEFVVKGVANCSTVAFFDADVYQYRLGREGQSVEFSSWFRNIDKACGVTLHVSDYFERVIARSSAVDPSVRRWALEQCIGSVNYKCTLMQMMGGGRKTFERFVGFLRTLEKTSPTVYSEFAKEKPDRLRMASNYLLFSLASIPMRSKSFLFSCFGR